MMRAIRFLIPLVVFYYIFSQIDFGQFIDVLSGADKTILIITFVLNLLTIVLQSMRWWVLAGEKWADGRFWKYLHVNFSAMAFDIFIPGKIGSDTYRAVQFKEQFTLTKMFTVLFAMRLQTLVVGAVLAWITLVFSSEILPALFPQLRVVTFVLVSLLLALVCFASLFFVLVPAYRRYQKKLSQNDDMPLAQKLHQVFESLHIICRSRQIVFQSCALLVVFILFNVFLYYLVGKAFGVHLHFFDYLAVVPLLLFAGTLPITIHGRGITELIAIVAWTAVGMSTESVIAICLAVYGLALGQSLLAALYWGIMRWIPQKKSEQGGAHHVI